MSANAEGLGSKLDGLLPEAVFLNEFQKSMQTKFNKFQIGSKDKNNWE